MNGTRYAGIHQLGCFCIYAPGLTIGVNTPTSCNYAFSSILPMKIKLLFIIWVQPGRFLVTQLYQNQMTLDIQKENYITQQTIGESFVRSRFNLDTIKRNKNSV